jgi:DNA-binding NarL/FixJ family response regulator
MSPAEPLLILTDDDLLAERWQALGRSPSAPAGSATSTPGAAPATGWCWSTSTPAAPTPLWQHAAWQRNAAGLAILAASAQPNDDEGLAVLNAGASGYCHTHAPTATLRQALDVIAGGELWVGRALLSRLLRLVDTRLPRVGLAHWSAPSPSEREVAQLAAIGDSNLTIADALGITERTVKAHLKAVFEKLQVADRLQLALRVHGVR